MEHRISGPGPLLDEGGFLREPGWSDRLELRYDRSAIRAPAWRIKEWDYYLILTRSFGLALTVADNGYMGLISATVLDFEAPAETTKTVMTAFPMGRWALPTSSASGLTAVREGGADISFEAAGASRRLRVSWPLFSAGGLEGEIVLREAPGGASMVIATPFRRPRRGFYYNQKMNCLAAEGSFSALGREFAFIPGEASAVLDWGRGVWPWSNAWLWGSASGYALSDAAGPLPFGFNIGYGFGDTGAASENMVFYGARAHKIGRLRIDFDARDFMRPWRAVSEDGRLDMTLRPVLDRASSADFGLLASIQHQVFGSWEGYAMLDDGSRVEFADLRGFCEKVVNRW
jgi:hypothetical protein